ncbi:MAG: lipoyl(octanoyl) transferase LipB [Enterobacterales bacterium]
MNKTHDINNSLIIKIYGLQEYKKILLKMQNFTNKRNKFSLDEIWFLQHYPVFTHGQNINIKDILKYSNIPIINSDRGGQITFHGPGQQIIYFMINLRRKKFNIKKLIFNITKIIINSLLYFKINSEYNQIMPGIYVNSKKICSLGFRIKNGCSFHGLALNVSMNLYPFTYINPCGKLNLKMTQMHDLIPKINISKVLPILINETINVLNIKYASIQIK